MVCVLAQIAKKSTSLLYCYFCVFFGAYLLVIPKSDAKSFSFIVLIQTYETICVEAYKMGNQGEEGSASGMRPQQEKKGKRTSRVEAEKGGRVLHPCESCAKVYQSYPALYTHVKAKHPGLQISSANPDKKPSVPVHKLSGILKSANEERDALERRLLNHLNYVNIGLQREFVRSQSIELALLGGRVPPETMGRVQESGRKQGANCGVVDVILEEGMKEISREHFGLTGPISFGATVLAFYCRNEDTAAKLWLQLALIGARDLDLVSDDKLRIETKRLWRAQAASVGEFLGFEWAKWRSVNKDLLKEDYPEPEDQDAQFNFNPKTDSQSFKAP